MPKRKLTSAEEQLLILLLLDEGVLSPEGNVLLGKLLRVVGQDGLSPDGKALLGGIIQFMNDLQPKEEALPFPKYSRISRWLAEFCEEKPDFSEPFERLLESWQNFCYCRDELPGNSASFGRELRRYGLSSEMRSGSWVVNGIRLTANL